MQMGSTSETEDCSKGKLIIEPMVILDENEHEITVKQEMVPSIVENIHPLYSLIMKAKSTTESNLKLCPLCKKYFKRIDHHMMSHKLPTAMDVGFICDFCHKGFKNLSNLTVHLRVHTGYKPFVCEICTKGFTQSCNLVNHMRTHTGDRPFKCPTCSRAFTQSGNLNNHMRLHTQEKPFICHICEKAFTQSSNLNSHLKNNHKFMHFIA